LIPHDIGRLNVDRLLLRPEEAAEVLGLGRTTIYELMGTGAIESVRIGGCRRVPMAALEAFVEGLRQAEAPAGSG